MKDHPYSYSILIYGAGIRPYSCGILPGISPFVIDIVSISMGNANIQERNWMEAVSY